MELKSKTAAPAESLRITESWVWPLTAAIVIGGSILFWCFVGLFWLALRPVPQPVVIRVVHSDLAIKPAESVASNNSAERNERGTP
jgi:hypothetical protein